MAVPPPPNLIEDDAVLFDRYVGGDMDAREGLARRYMPMARRLAARYRSSAQPRDDLEQVAYMGLLKAIDRFDASAGSFTAYAIGTIRGELKRHFRDHGWGIRMTRPLQERWLLVKQAIETLSARTGRSPTPRALSEHMDLPIDDVTEAIEAGDAYRQLSLDAPIANDDDGSRTLADSCGADDRGYASAEWRIVLTPLFAELPEREQKILHLRFVDDLNQSEIAEQIGVSQMHISRLIKSSLLTLSDGIDE